MRLRLSRIISLVLLLIGMIYTTIAHARSWDSWVADLRQEALAQGINSELFDSLFDGMQPGAQQIQLLKNQPERRLTFLQYRNSRVDKYRISIGRQQYNNNRSLCNSLGQQYGVDPTFVIAIWGLETSYGNFTGNFPVIKSLATLAYQGDRPALFRQELLLALQILNEGHITPDKFKGEWAGASGQPQFLPSSWFKYAVDYDGDGHKDIWTSKPDALASIANYLKMNGWEDGQPWGVQVSAPADIPSRLIGIKTQRPVSFWLQHGVQVTEGELPRADTMASLVEPDGGPDYLVFNNFRVILKYNNSIYYAASIAYLADEIKQ